MQSSSKYLSCKGREVKEWGGTLKDQRSRVRDLAALLTNIDIKTQHFSVVSSYTYIFLLETPTHIVYEDLKDNFIGGGGVDLISYCYTLLCCCPRAQ